KLFSESLTPLCSPQLRSARRLRRPEDLRHVRLLHDTSVPGAGEANPWKRWLEAAGAPQVSARSGLSFTLAEHALQAAIDGAGVVLGRLGLAEGDIDTGRLVRPFRLALPLDVGYFLVAPRRRRERSEIQCFREWIVEAVSRTALACERPDSRRRAIR
ncbi:MAG TPA: LysR substrate-binding domain-containing protein, partial [Usitatibacter sp.]|nr:LysR substrate-binding domain-containing protein [Usitatibacter sp.]